MAMRAKATMDAGRAWLAATSLVALAAAASPAWAQDGTYEWGWRGHPMMWMWGAWGIGMMFMMFVFWGLVIAGIVLAIRWLVRGAGGAAAGGGADRALDILRERYARGEIDRDEFEAKRRDLGR